MDKIKIIAIEKVFVGGGDEFEPCIACAYKNNQLFVYDTFGSLYQQKEYFDTFDNLRSSILDNKYEWCYFELSVGNLIARDCLGNICVDGERVDMFNPLREKNTISAISIKLYYNFLCRLYKSNDDLLNQLKDSFASGEFKEDIVNIVKDNPLHELALDDQELIVRSRINGYDFISAKMRQFLKSNDPYKLNQITFYFTRLFKLEYYNYIDFREG